MFGSPALSSLLSYNVCGYLPPEHPHFPVPQAFTLNSPRAKLIMLVIQLMTLSIPILLKGDCHSKTKCDHYFCCSLVGILMDE